jgi:hypothetical protein
MKVGDKLKAFKHEAEVYGMEKYVGKIGTIIALTDYDIELEFNDGASWYYPINKHKIVVIKEQPTDQIVESVINQFKQRSELGIAKYGTTLDRNDLSTLEWIEHAKQEAMDFILYLERLKQELK